MTEASRVQNMLNEQNAWIDKLKSEVMRLNLELVGYKVRKIQLEAALREIDTACDYSGAEYVCRGIARAALEWKDD